MTQERDIHELIKQRDVMRMARKEAKGAAAEAELAVLQYAVDQVLGTWRCESVPELLLMPVPQFLFEPASVQGWFNNELGTSTPSTMDVGLPVYNLINEVLSTSKTKSYDYDRFLREGFLLLPETQVRNAIHTSWLLDMNAGKYSLNLKLTGNIPFIRCFQSDQWGVLFPENIWLDHETLTRCHSIWKVKDKFQAVKLALQLAVQKPAYNQSYILPHGAVTHFEGWPVEKMFG